MSSIRVLSNRALMMISPFNNISNPISVTSQSQQVRFNHWPDWRMKKDYRKRQTVIKLSGERDRINTIRKNDILPREIRELADLEMSAFPRDSMYTRVINRCVITSRPKSCVKRWRVSRIMFRLLADYNKLSGVQRALWA